MRILPTLPVVTICAAVGLGLAWRGLPIVWQDTWAGAFPWWLLALRWAILAAGTGLFLAMAWFALRASLRDQR